MEPSQEKQAPKMKSIYQTCIPRKAVLDGTADSDVNLEEIPKPDKAGTREFVMPISWKTPHYKWALNSR
ncbi:MAG: hypothetical protein QG552_2078 [Thermodesulfobacteriota bacterium]|nr:hypothetical protein [Thermodesulfobacteriota bacterium]